MRNRVVVTGLGCITPLGNDVATFWKNNVEGKSGVGAITLFDASEHGCKIAAEVKGFDPVALFGSKEARRMDRFTQFALAAAGLAIDDAKLDISDANRDRIGVVIGSGIGGMIALYEQFKLFIERGPSRISPFLIPMMIPDTAGGMVALNYGLRGPNMAVVAACATSNYAIGEAVEIIRRGSADVMLTGGSEAVIQPISMAGLCNMTALSTRNDDAAHASRPFDKTRDGFVMGEGSGILILESLESARARNARIYCEITGFGASNDAYHITAPLEDGSGAAKCMRNAIDDAGLTIYDIGYINAHGTSTPLNDKSETAAIKLLFGEQAYNVPVSSTKSMIGHLLGAAGAVEAVVCAKAIEGSTLPPTINYQTPDPECDLDYIPNQARSLPVQHIMSNSFGFGGHNASLIFSRYHDGGSPGVSSS